MPFEKDLRSKLSIALALAPLVYMGNPALALLVGMTISITIDRVPIANGSAYGKYLLQAAIVLLGLKLNAAQLLDIGGTYALPIAGLVCAVAARIIARLACAQRSFNQCVDFLAPPFAGARLSQPYRPSLPLALSKPAQRCASYSYSMPSR